MKASFKINNAKVGFSKDIDKVLEYFRYTTGTTLDAIMIRVLKYHPSY